MMMMMTAVQPQKMTVATESRRALGSSYSFAYPDAGWGTKPGRGNWCHNSADAAPPSEFQYHTIFLRRRQKVNLQSGFCTICYMYFMTMLSVYNSAL